MTKKAQIRTKFQDKFCGTIHFNLFIYSRQQLDLAPTSEAHLLVGLNLSEGPNRWVYSQASNSLSLIVIEEIRSQSLQQYWSHWCFVSASLGRLYLKPESICNAAIYISRKGGKKGGLYVLLLYSCISTTV